METITITLSDEESRRLAAIAAYEGATPEALAKRVVRDRLVTDAEWEAEVRAAMTEADAGDVVSWEEYCTDMDRFVASLAEVEEEKAGA